MLGEEDKRDEEEFTGHEHDHEEDESYEDDDLDLGLGPKGDDEEYE
jgi:hypothetical protein